MTPAEKAESLVLSFLHVPDEAMKRGSEAAWIDKILAKRCAIICVEQIIEATGANKDENNNYWGRVLEYIKSM